MDFCANKGTYTDEVTMPDESPDDNAPTALGLTTIRVGFSNFYTSQLSFSATDDTGIRRVAVGSQKDRTPVSQNLSPSSSLLPDRASACPNQWPSV
jgi:hypothetical protein